MDDAVQFVDFDDYTTLVDEYTAAKIERDKAAAVADELRAQILKLLPTEEQAPEGCIITVGGHARLSWRPYPQRRIDQFKLRDLYPSVSTACTTWELRWQLRELKGDQP